MTHEEVVTARDELARKNKNLRNDITRCKANIKELERKIEIEKWAIQATGKLISQNTEKFVELGKLL